MIVAALAVAALLSVGSDPVVSRASDSTSARVGASQPAASSTNALQTAQAQTGAIGETQSVLPQSLPSQSTQPAKFDSTRFDSATASALRVILESANQNGLPTQVLYNRALQGTAQHAPGARIVGLVKAHFVAMLDARAALGSNSTESELDTGADALRAGVDGKVLQSIRSVRTAPGSAISALVVLPDLMKRGISENKARDAVMSLARASRSDDGINGLQMAVARNAERGPGMAQDALERYVKTYVSGAPKTAPIKTPATSRPPNLPDAS